MTQRPVEVELRIVPRSRLRRESIGEAWLVTGHPAIPVPQPGTAMEAEKVMVAPLHEKGSAYSF